MRTYGAQQLGGIPPQVVGSFLGDGGHIDGPLGALGHGAGASERHQLALTGRLGNIATLRKVMHPREAARLTWSAQRRHRENGKLLQEHPPPLS